jgi:hypothetical protein
MLPDFFWRGFAQGFTDGSDFASFPSDSSTGLSTTAFVAG